MIASTTPVFNLKAVLTETGIKADVLRAWERRYGIPMPVRTAGGHRLYSQRDIDTIKWLMARQREGLTISRAVDLWKELSTDGDPLTQAETPTPSFVSSTRPLSTNTMDQLRTQWLDACKQFNETGAEQVLNQAFAMYPPEVVVSEVLQRGLHDIGELWFENKASVQQEHFASALAMRRLDTLLSGTPLPSLAQSIIVACPPEEWHTFTPLMLSLFLRRRGWNVVYLGANNPNTRLMDTINTIQPRLVILASQQLYTASRLAETADMLASEGVQVAYGGRIFNIMPELRQRIRGHFLGESVEQAIQTIDDLAQRPRYMPMPHESLGAYKEAHEVFLAKRPHIESRLLQSFRSRNLPTHYLETANKFFGDLIAAGLGLGDMRYIESDLDWLRTLLSQYNISPDTIHPFIHAYTQCSEEELGAHANLITNWSSHFLLENSPKNN